MVVTVVVGVLAFTALLVWMMWRLYRSVERMERDQRYIRRVLLRGAIFYGASAMLGVVLVATGKEPILSLAGLPVVALLVWFNVKTAVKVKVPAE